MPDSQTGTAGLRAHPWVQRSQRLAGKPRTGLRSTKRALDGWEKYLNVDLLRTGAGGPAGPSTARCRDGALPRPFRTQDRLRKHVCVPFLCVTSSLSLPPERPVPVGLQPLPPLLSALRRFSPPAPCVGNCCSGAESASDKRGTLRLAAAAAHGRRPAAQCGTTWRTPCSGS